MKILFITAVYIIFGLIGVIEAQLRKNNFLSTENQSDDVVSDDFVKSVAFRYADHQLKMNRLPTNFFE